MKRHSRLLATAGVGLVLMACGSDAPQVGTSAGPASSQTHSIASTLPGPPSFRWFIRTTEAVVEADVVNVTTLWNSDDGQPWDGDTGTYSSLPVQYRNVTIKVTKVIASSDALPLTEGQTLDIYAKGNGSDDSSKQTNLGISAERLGGTYEKGEHKLLFLHHVDDIPFQHGKRAFIEVNGGFYNTWHVDGDKLTNLDARRNGTKAKLVAIVAKERASSAPMPGETQADNTSTEPFADPQTP